jgi:uncharacterized protein YdhG (YjbR/CyaY superfamily)
MTVDEYIAGFPKPVQTILRRIRKTILAAAPDAEESISYRIPTYKLNGHPVIYFAAFKTHIGLYPVTPPVKKKFKKELSEYKGGKGTVRFQLDEPIPYALIARIAKYKRAEASRG